MAAGLPTFGLAFLLRYLPGARLEAVPFITLFPAILIAALVGGLSVGILVAGFSFLAGWYFFLPPSQAWAIDDVSTVWALLFFWITAGIQLYVIHALNHALESLASERDRSAVLFRELQHRVANNMTFVARLLRLERKTIQIHPERATLRLDQAVVRLETIARMHRRLYDPESVPLRVTLQALAKDIVEAAGATGITCVVEVSPDKLELSRLVTLSLLINELITNSLKHGFAGRQSGRIDVKLHREADTFVLTVQDNGSGFAPDAERRETLGMTIIHSLVGQLGGKITWSCASGTTVRLAFPA